jgi:hypothetical protein
MERQPSHRCGEDETAEGEGKPDVPGAFHS